MDCEYWRDIVAQLSDPQRCNWAAHVLSTEVPGHPAETGNLGEALRCVGRDEILVGVIKAYRDWSAQVYCDLILARFETGEVASAFLTIGDADDLMRAGVFGFLESKDPAKAEQLLSVLKREG
jgi:hypothetical protein